MHRILGDGLIQATLYGSVNIPGSQRLAGPFEDGGHRLLNGSTAELDGLSRLRLALRLTKNPLSLRVQALQAILDPLFRECSY